MFQANRYFASTIYTINSVISINKIKGSDSQVKNSRSFTHKRQRPRNRSASVSTQPHSTAKRENCSRQELMFEKSRINLLGAKLASQLASKHLQRGFYSQLRREPITPDITRFTPMVADRTRRKAKPPCFPPLWGLGSLSPRDPVNDRPRPRRIASFRYKYAYYT